MLSRTDTLAGERWAHDDAAWSRAAEDGKREGKMEMFTGASMRSLHMNGRTEAAATEASDDVCSVMMATAAATAGAPSERKDARTSAEASITTRAQVRICNCCSEETDGRRPIIRKILSVI